MKIAILTLGTRGDVQPYAVLGKALQAKGHEVTLATARNFESLVSAYGIRFLPIDADFQALLDSDEGKKMMKGNPLAVRRNLATWVYPLIQNALESFYALALQSDLVVYHVKTLADSFADQFPQKMIRASVVPAVEGTSAFPNPSFSGFPLPSFLNKFSYTLTNFSMRLLSKPIQAYRKKHSLPRRYKMPPIMNLYGISPSFLPRPHDYAAASAFTGFWLEDSGKALPEALLQFIKEGAPPLLVTFGSMPFAPRFNLQEALIEITQALEIRCIVVRGWGLQHTAEMEKNKNIKVIDAAPYDQLFPLVKAVVHHGGVGTTAECLRAGKPFFTCPVLYPLGDQQFWGQLGYRHGLAVKPVPMKKLTLQQFNESIHQLLTNETLYTQAQRMGEQIRAENGVATAVAEIEKHATAAGIVQ